MINETDKSFITRSKRASIDRETAKGRTGMVASAHHLATDIGEKVLESGGNAIDAAVAIQFALNVAEPMMTGIGGSGFMMVHHRDSNETKIFDGHTRAPKAAHPRMFLDDSGEVVPFKQRSTHGTAVGVPGILKAMDTALSEYGTKSLAELIEPSIELAEKGVEINWVFKDALEHFDYRLGKHAKNFYLPEGKHRKEGEKLMKKELAHTYRILQEKGTAAFYEGEIGEAIIAALKEEGGFMELDDLKNYQITIDEPMWGEYKGYKIASSSPPSAGGLMVIHILKLLESFQLEQYGPRSWEKYYLLAEAMRIGFSDKVTYFGDPEFVEMPVKGLIDDRYIDERRKLINFERRNDAIEFGNPWKYDKPGAHHYVSQPDDIEKSETTHFTVTDQWGNIAACTSTVEHPFGSGIMVPGYGFILNNELTDFDAVPGGLNEVQPGKRPVSCKSPTIIFKDDRPFLTLGSPGGPTIIGSVFQTIINVIDFKMDLKEAIEEPRIMATTGPLIEWEKGISMESKGILESMGYQFADEPHVIGNVQAIQFDQKTGTIYGVADSSREGKASGMN
ncbi:gamma-glutamyltransferase [Bacillus sp. V3-13]|uniref:gamma-glutamyltransferase n=1 Tax=Bacillus sp. V3-13 TaxID=2053728 RepID=UPI000C7739F1|nr:gamma-glutamyltransferase [Bacillus sp. V3-13]PLR76936.1 gamma-glutamyltransferase [Bacillus sp. V3-13]